MSRILPDMVRKQVTPTAVTAAQAVVLVQETCVAEAVHWGLSAAGLLCLRLWRGLWGAAISLAYFLLGNLPFILIQRYNRPRLAGLLERVRERKTQVMEV